MSQNGISNNQAGFGGQVPCITGNDSDASPPKRQTPQIRVNRCLVAIDHRTWREILFMRLTLPFVGRLSIEIRANSKMNSVDPATVGRVDVSGV
jgi:hypothetical protein